MNLTEYQTAAAEYAAYDNELYPFMSIMVEAAELSDIFIKPWLRGDDKEVDRQEVVSEAGDVLWNLALLLDEVGVSLDEVAEYNIQKLQSRKNRGVIRGSGGSR